MAMRGIEVSWIWETKGPLHCGTGLARPGYADHLVQVDDKKRPFIPGDAVKGALRMAAEQVLHWIGQSDIEVKLQRRGDESGTLEPSIEPMVTLFGGAGRCRYGDATLLGTAAPSKNRRVSTAIDRSNGVARKDTLRSVEVVESGLSFECKASFWCPEDRALRDAVVTMFVCTLAATESVGAKRAIGWGTVALKDVKVRIGQTESPASEVVDEARVKDLLAYLTKRAGPSIDPEGEKRAVEKPTDAPEPRWRCLEITLKGATCLGHRPEGGNHLATNHHLPATAVRGALIAHWLRHGYTWQEIVPWIDGATFWTDGLPVEGDELCFLSPRSFLGKKRSEPGASETVLDTLDVENDKAREMGKAQWVRMSPRWAFFNKKESLSMARSTTRSRATMHVARDYASGSKRMGALFSRESLHPESKFRLWAKLPAEAPLKPEREEVEIFLGRRQSVGSGAATLRVSDTTRFCPVPAADNRQPGDGTNDSVIQIQLLSPAIVRGPTGHPLRSLGEHEWVQIVDGIDSQDDRRAAIGDIEKITAFTGSSAFAGWQSRWGHHRSPVTAIDAGSVWRIRFANQQAAATWRKRLSVLQDTGLGESTHEGFGWFLIDPPWLGRPGEQQLTVPQPQEERQGPVAWPGCENLKPEDLRDIAAEVLKLDKAIVPATLRSPLHEIVTLLSSQGLAKAIEHYKSMAGRDRPAWKPLRENAKVRLLLEKHEKDVGLFRFTLRALIARCGR